MVFPPFPGFYSVGAFFSSLVSTRNTDKTISKNEKLEMKRQAVQKELAELQRQTHLDIHKDNIQFQLYRLEKEQSLQRELVAFNSQRQLEIAHIHRASQLELPEVHKIFENWPLRVAPIQILEAHKHKSVPPLRVLISPPSVDFDKFVHPNPAIVQSATPVNFPKIERKLAGILHDNLNTDFALNSEKRPIELLDGAWDSSRYCGGASLLALSSKLSSVPTLILDLEVNEDCLTLWTTYWGLGQNSHDGRHKIISDFPYRDILYESAKYRALKWKSEVRDKLLAEGKSIEEINQKYGGDNAANLAILEEDKEFRKKGITGLERHYQVSQEDWKELLSVLGIYHVLVTGVIADGHFLLHHNISPIFHTLLPNLLAKQKVKNIAPIIDWMLACYDDLFQAASVERNYQVADLRLELAKNLARLDNKSWAKQELVKSLEHWFKRRGITLKRADLDALLSEMLTLPSELFTGSQDYLSKLNETLRQVGGYTVVSRKVTHLISLVPMKKAIEKINETALVSQQPEQPKLTEQSKPKRRWRYEVHNDPFAPFLKEK
jgi:hypothetical protein